MLPNLLGSFVSLWIDQVEANVLVLEFIENSNDFWGVTIADGAVRSHEDKDRGLILAVSQQVHLFSGEVFQDWMSLLRAAADEQYYVGIQDERRWRSKHGILHNSTLLLS